MISFEASRMPQAMWQGRQHHRQKIICSWEMGSLGFVSKDQSHTRMVSVDFDVTCVTCPLLRPPLHCNPQLHFSGNIESVLPSVFRRQRSRLKTISGLRLIDITLDLVNIATMFDCQQCSSCAYMVVSCCHIFAPWMTIIMLVPQKLARCELKIIITRIRCIAFREEKSTQRVDNISL